MSTEIKIPNIGESITEVPLLLGLKRMVNMLKKEISFVKLNRIKQQ